MMGFFLYCESFQPSGLITSRSRSGVPVEMTNSRVRSSPSTALISSEARDFRRAASAGRVPAFAFASHSFLASQVGIHPPHPESHEVDKKKLGHPLRDAESSLASAATVFLTSSSQSLRRRSTTRQAFFSAAGADPTRGFCNGGIGGGP